MTQLNLHDFLEPLHVQRNSRVNVQKAKPRKMALQQSLDNAMFGNVLPVSAHAKQLVGTGAERQSRRTDRLAARGISRTSVLVHEEARRHLEIIRPALLDPTAAKELAEIFCSKREASPVNVSQVQHRSPFRYPGGKTWLVPEVRAWITHHEVERLVEPFAGGASCGLMVAAEGLASVVLGEIDPLVAAVWELTINSPLTDVEWLCDRILTFECTLPNVLEALETPGLLTREIAWQTIVRNRCARGGIMAPGAGFTKTGEAGKGIASRWYPETLVRRIRDITTLRPRLKFEQIDALKMIKRFRRNTRTAWFIDPPYTASSKSAGSRLYSSHTLDHSALFSVAASCAGPVMMTYDDSPQVRRLATDFGFSISTVPMKSTHHATQRELVLTRG
jgi:DNA adenine methylase